MSSPLRHDAQRCSLHRVLSRRHIAHYVPVSAVASSILPSCKVIVIVQAAYMLFTCARCLRLLTHSILWQVALKEGYLHLDCGESPPDNDSYSEHLVPELLVLISMTNGARLDMRNVILPCSAAAGNFRSCYAERRSNNGM